MKQEIEFKDKTKAVIVRKPEIPKVEIAVEEITENLDLGIPDSTLEMEQDDQFVEAVVEEMEMKIEELAEDEVLTLQCKICLELGFVSTEELAVHRKIAHDVKFPYQCGNLDCPATFIKAEDLENHACYEIIEKPPEPKKRFNRAPKQFMCEICSKVWPKSVNDLKFLPFLMEFSSTGSLLWNATWSPTVELTISSVISAGRGLN